MADKYLLETSTIDGIALESDSGNLLLETSVPLPNDFRGGGGFFYVREATRRRVYQSITFDLELVPHMAIGEAVKVETRILPVELIVLRAAEFPMIFVYSGVTNMKASPIIRKYEPIRITQRLFFDAAQDVHIPTTSTKPLRQRIEEAEALLGIKTVL